MNFLKTSVEAEIDIRMISATYIAFIGKKPHQPWVICQLQETAHLQEIKAEKQGECEQ